MRQLLVYFLLFLLVVLLLPKPVSSELSVNEFVIDNEQRWTVSPGKAISSLIVSQNGHLFIEPGVQLRFSKGAVVQVAGKLSIMGSDSQTVRFTAESLDQRWQGLRVSGHLEAEYFELSYADQAITITGTAGTLRHLNLLDNRDNTIVISGGRGGDFRLQDSRFERIISGDDAGSSGLLIRRDEIDSYIQDIVFREERVFAIQPDFIGIKIEAADVNSNAIRVSHSHGCWLHGFMGHYQIGAAIGFRRETCSNAQVPLIFVPGFGASIDLESLANPYFRHYDQKRWWFLPALVPAYQDFLKAVRERSIPYSVARYDWRLPADRIASDYLEPLIRDVKKKYGVSRVNIVAHSYGGLVARSYIQGSAYKNDVLSLITLGTPHYGTYKAYPVWQSGELPKDWEIMKVLIEYYRYRGYMPFANDSAIIRAFFGSVSELQPVYPALKRGGLFIDPGQLLHRNRFLLDLNANLEILKQRVRVVTYYADGVSTPTWTNVGTPGVNAAWPDGKPEGSIQLSAGDGTVPAQSAVLEGVQRVRVSGSHFDLPKTAVNEVLADLTPSRIPLQPSLIGDLGWKKKPVVWYYADCPVVMTITTPDGSSYSSAADQKYWDPDLISDPELVGLVKNDEMTWMAVPEQPGTYTVTITAKEDTEVRYWRGDEEPKVMAMLRAGEQWVSKEQLGNAKLPSESQTVIKVGPVKGPAPSMTTAPDLSTVDQLTDVSELINQLDFQISWPFRYELAFLNPLDLPRLVRYKFDKKPVSEEVDLQHQTSQKNLSEIAIIIVTGLGLLIMLRRWQK